jgi:hypothetical protein
MKQTKQNPQAAVPIMDAEAIRRALRRIAHEIIERNPPLEKVVLAGIPSRGVEIARRVAAFIREIEKIDIETGVIDATTSERGQNCRWCAPLDCRCRWRIAPSSFSMMFFTPDALLARPWTPSIRSGAPPASNWPC